MARRVLFLALLAASCGGEPARPARAPAPRPKSGETAVNTPPAWAVRYTSANKVRVPLDDARHMEVGKHGDRWLVSREGRVQSTSYLPRAIVTSARTSAGEIALVSDDGTIFPVTASDPLGPIGAARVPPSPLSGVMVGRSAILARAQQRIARTTDGGRTWVDVDVGGAPRVLHSVAIARDGLGALLQIPQRTLLTADDGATWTHVPAPPGGVSEVTSENDGAFVGASSTEGAPSMIVAGDPLRWARRPANVAASTAPPAPKMEYVAKPEGESALAGASWLELVRAERGLELWIEDLAGVEQPRALHPFHRCQEASFGASSSGQTIVVACRADTNSPALAITRSADGGAHWRDDPPLTASEHGALRVYTSDTQLVVTGACVPDKTVPCPLGAASAGAESWSNVELTSKDGRDYVLEKVAPTAGGFVGIATEADGERMIAVVSTDGSAHAEVTTRFDGGVPFDQQLSVDGDVGVLSTSSVEAPLHVTRDGGRSWRSMTLPEETRSHAGIAFAGLRGLATTPTGVFESLDGGATWTKLDAPVLADPGAVRCAPAGCILGDALRRLGWSAPPASGATGEPPIREPAAQAPREGTAQGGAPPAAYECTPIGEPERVPGWFEQPLVDLEGGLRWSILVNEAAPADGTRARPSTRVKLLAERVRDGRASRESADVARRHPPLFSQTRNAARGVTVLEFPGVCAFDCHGFLYDSTGPIAVSWVPSSGGAVRYRSLTPHDKIHHKPVDAVVMPDGTVLVAVADHAYVLDTKGATKKVRGHAWDVVTIAKKTISIAGAIDFFDNDAIASPAASWTLEPSGVGAYDLPPRAGIARSRGAPVAWSRVDAAALLVKLDSVEEEPSSVARVDLAKLFGSRPLPACRPGARGDIRIPIEMGTPFAVTIAIAGGEASQLLSASDVVVRASTEGTACVSALVAHTQDHRRGLLLDLTDPAHATTFESTSGQTSSLQGARCVPR